MHSASMLESGLDAVTTPYGTYTVNDVAESMNVATDPLLRLGISHGVGTDGSRVTRGMSTRYALHKLPLRRPLRSNHTGRICMLAVCTNFGWYTPLTGRLESATRPEAVILDTHCLAEVERSS